MSDYPAPHFRMFEIDFPTGQHAIVSIETDSLLAEDQLERVAGYLTATLTAAYYRQEEVALLEQRIHDDVAELARWEAGRAVSGGALLADRRSTGVPGGGRVIRRMDARLAAGAV